MIDVCDTTRIFPCWTRTQVTLEWVVICSNDIYIYAGESNPFSQRDKVSTWVEGHFGLPFRRIYYHRNRIGELVTHPFALEYLVVSICPSTELQDSPKPMCDFQILRIIRITIGRTCVVLCTMDGTLATTQAAALNLWTAYQKKSNKLHVWHTHTTTCSNQIRALNLTARTSVKFDSTRSWSSTVSRVWSFRPY
jgi:hypothetical protein